MNRCIDLIYMLYIMFKYSKDAFGNDHDEGGSWEKLSKLKKPKKKSKITY